MSDQNNKVLIPGAIWITGITASGKTTLGLGLYNMLKEVYTNIILFDGEELRKNLPEKYGYTIKDRLKTNQHYINIVNQKVKKGKLVIICTVGHKRVMRESARYQINESFMEIYLKCPPSICAERDYKGLYDKAYEGHLDIFPGVTEPYEESEKQELVIDTSRYNFENSIKIAYNYVKKRFIVFALVW